MFKLLIFGLLIWILVSLLKKRLVRPAFERRQKSKQTRIVPCQYCGIHIPEPEATLHDDQHFCCQDHLEAYQNHEG